MAICDGGLYLEYEWMLRHRVRVNAFVFVGAGYVKKKRKLEAW